eukprot:4335080-Amphidinium_carterae.2
MDDGHLTAHATHDAYEVKRGSGGPFAIALLGLATGRCRLDTMWSECHASFIQALLLLYPSLMWSKGLLNGISASISDPPLRWCERMSDNTCHLHLGLAQAKFSTRGK